MNTFELGKKLGYYSELEKVAALTPEQKKEYDGLKGNIIQSGLGGALAGAGSAIIPGVQFVTGPSYAATMSRSYAKATKKLDPDLATVGGALTGLLPGSSMLTNSALGWVEGNRREERLRELEKKMK
jgi:hypothetical protein